jgi:dsRNA-specific ribonuclease
VLIPAFAVGRSQEVLLILKRALRNGALPKIPVFVDGMVRAVCAVYGRHERYVSRILFNEIRKQDHPFYANGIRPVTSPTQRQEALSAGPCVIVASSGMLAGGASAHYAAALASNPNDAILITGYQDEESPGRALLRIADSSGPRELKIGDRTVDVRCELEKYGLSAHADRMQMVGLVESLRPKTAVLVHGNDEARRALSSSLGVEDIVLPRDGQEVARVYPPRHSVSRAQAENRELSLDEARRLLGPPSGSPIPARRIAEAWFGEQRNAGEVSGLVGRLESLGLVRRDDHQRQLLFVLGPSETDQFPTEAALEEELRLENPKGRLLELCMRQRIEPPILESGIDGAFHTAILSLSWIGRPLTSGLQKAASKKTAEQLAARVLLRMIDNCDPAVLVVQVSDDEAKQLKIQNPKGRLLEWCAAHRAPLPSFAERAVIGGFHIQAAVALGTKNISTGWFGASTKKIAEQAAARALLAQLEAGADAPEPIPPQEDSPDADLEKAPAAQDCHSSPDPMMLLNEMRQIGVIRDFGYELQSSEGPSHQPLFTIAGWVDLENGERIEAEPTVSASKREGRRKAAEALIACLRQEGHLAARN